MTAAAETTPLLLPLTPSDRSFLQRYRTLVRTLVESADPIRAFQKAIDKKRRDFKVGDGSVEGVTRMETGFHVALREPVVYSVELHEFLVQQLPDAVEVALKIYLQDKDTREWEQLQALEEEEEDVGWEEECEPSENSSCRHTDCVDGCEQEEEQDCDNDTEEDTVEINAFRVYLPLVSINSSSCPKTLENQPELFTQDLLLAALDRIQHEFLQANLPVASVRPLEPLQNACQRGEQIANRLPQLEREMGVQLYTSSPVPFVLLWDIFHCLGLRMKPSEPNNNLYTFVLQTADLYSSSGSMDRKEEAMRRKEEEDTEDTEEDDSELYQVTFAPMRNAAEPLEADRLQFAFFFPYAIAPKEAWNAILVAVQYCTMRMEVQGYAVSQTLLGLWEESPQTPKSAPKPVRKGKKRTKPQDLMVQSLETMIEIVHGELGVALGEEDFQNIF